MKEAELQEIQVILDKPDKRLSLVYHQIEQMYYIKKVIKKFGKIDVYRNLMRSPHPNMPRIYEVRECGEWIVLFEEFVNGSSLEYYMSCHKLSGEEIDQIFLQVCSVVEHLHNFHPPIIHRDIKPANILYSREKAYLIDYDIAREFEQTQSKDTTVIGSVGYAAPEQYGFTQSDTRSDIYAMGVLLNEMITGEYPNVKLPSDRRREIVQKSIAMDPVNRYQHIQEMKQAYASIANVRLPMFQMDVLRKWYYETAFPGMKSSNMYMRTGAFMGYLMLVIISVNTSYQAAKTTFDLFIFRCVFFIFLLFTILIPCNYRNILHILPLYRSEYQFIRFLNGVIIWIMIMLAAIMTAAFLMGIFESML